MKKITLSLLFSFLLFSCEDMETVVNLDIPPHTPVLVLNSIIDTDSEVRVLVSHSVGAFEQIIPSCITDAEVLLFENNQFVDTLMIDLINTDITMNQTFWIGIYPGLCQEQLDYVAEKFEEFFWC